MKRQLVTHLQNQNKFFLWFLQYVFFFKTHPATGQQTLDSELWLSTKKMFKHENELLDFIQKSHLLKDNYESKYQLNDKEKVIMNAKNQLV